MIPKLTFNDQPATSTTTGSVTLSCPRKSRSRTALPFRFLFILSLALVLLTLPWRTTIKAQIQSTSHVPVIDKITSGAHGQQMFSGVVRSVDFTSDILNVDNVNGKSTEVFPIKSKVHVFTADGDKVKLSGLKPGTNVLVYFDQKGDHRTVTRIVVLAGGPPKKKTPPS